MCIRDRCVCVCARCALDVSWERNQTYPSYRLLSHSIIPSGCFGVNIKPWFSLLLSWHHPINIMVTINAQFWIREIYISLWLLRIREPIHVLHIVHTQMCIRDSITDNKVTYINRGWNSPFWPKNYTRFWCFLIYLLIRYLNEKHHRRKIIHIKVYMKKVLYTTKLIPIQFAQLGLKFKSSGTSEGKNRAYIFVVNISETPALMQKMVRTKIVQ